MSFIYYAAIAVFLVMCVVLCASILVQESKGAGGMGALGGGVDGGGDSLFGTSTPEVLKRFSGWLVFAFFVSCVVLSLWTAAFERSRGTPHFSIDQVEGVE